MSEVIHDGEIVTPVEKAVEQPAVEAEAEAVAEVEA